MKKLLSVLHSVVVKGRTPITISVTIGSLTISLIVHKLDLRAPTFGLTIASYFRTPFYAVTEVYLGVIGLTLDVYHAPRLTEQDA